jgi:hypothetical protein
MENKRGEYDGRKPRKHKPSDEHNRSGGIHHQAAISCFVIWLVNQFINLFLAPKYLIKILCNCKDILYFTLGFHRVRIKTKGHCFHG